MDITHAAVDRWLSAPRFGVYLNATHGHTAEAMELYDWNAAVASACLRDVGHFEVLIRNRYAERLDSEHPGWTSTGNPLWSMLSGYPATRTKQQDLNKGSRAALFKAKRPSNATPGQIIANLMFGFWAKLTAAPRVDTIWTPVLSDLFPAHSRGHVHDRMNKLNDFRNRLAHWEPVFSSTTGLTTRLAEFEQFFTVVDPDVASWVGERSTVLNTIEECPISDLVLMTNPYLGRMPLPDA